MKSSSTVMHHTLCLTPPQQAALRYCLYNMAQMKIVQYLDFSNKNPEANLEKIGSNILDIWKNYDLISPLLSPFQGHESFKGKMRLLLYNETYFQFVVEAVNRYNYETAELVVGRDIAMRINSQMNTLAEAVHQSSFYTYSLEEIKKAGQ